MHRTRIMSHFPGASTLTPYQLRHRSFFGIPYGMQPAADLSQDLYSQARQLAAQLGVTMPMLTNPSLQYFMNAPRSIAPTPYSPPVFNTPSQYTNLTSARTEAPQAIGDMTPYLGLQSGRLTSPDAIGPRELFRTTTNTKTTNYAQDDEWAMMQRLLDPLGIRSRFLSYSPLGSLDLPFQQYTPGGLQGFGGVGYGGGDGGY